MFVIGNMCPDKMRKGEQRESVLRERNNFVFFIQGKLLWHLVCSCFLNDDIYMQHKRMKESLDLEK